MIKYFIGRGFLHPEKLKIAEKLRGKRLVDCEDSTVHNGVAEIRLCPYIYYCYTKRVRCHRHVMRPREIPIREQWIKDGILKNTFIPEFTAKGKKFIEYVLRWAYPTDYAEMVLQSK